MLSGAMQNAVEGANAAVAAAGEAVAKVDRTALEDGLTHLREASDQLVRDVKSGVVALSEDAKRTDASPSALIASIKTQTQEAMQLFTDTPSASKKENRGGASAPWDVEALPENEKKYASGLRERMLKLVVDAIYSRPRREALFLSGKAAADNFTFDADSEPERAMAVLEADPNVKRLRAGLVPAKLKENAFWAEYFWHVRHTRRLLVAHNGKLARTSDEDVEVFEKCEGVKEAQSEGDSEKVEVLTDKTDSKTPGNSKAEEGAEKDWDKEIDEIFDS